MSRPSPRRRTDVRASCIGAKRDSESPHVGYLWGVAQEAGTRGEAVGLADVEQAADAVGPLVRRTPMLEAGELSRRFGGPVWLKAECLQRTGSFKIRGASNAIARLDRARLAAGVCAASAGNHAQAVALAARRRGAAAEVFMPASAPLAKVAAVRASGATVRLRRRRLRRGERRRSPACRDERHEPHPCLRRPRRGRGPGNDRTRDRGGPARDAPDRRPARRRRPGGRNRHRGDRPAARGPGRRGPGRSVRAVRRLHRGAPADRRARSGPRSATASPSSGPAS